MTTNTIDATDAGHEAKLLAFNRESADGYLTIATRRFRSNPNEATMREVVQTLEYLVRLNTKAA